MITGSHQLLRYISWLFPALVATNIMPAETRSRSRRQINGPVEKLDLDSENSLPHIPVHLAPDEPPGSTESESGDDSDSHPRGLEGDRGNIALLMFLYVLQGIPLGLAGSIPYLLQSRDVNYKQQAMFSFVYWPFSVKLLWAPIVDSAYFPVFGRRKSWLVPTQYMIGFFMLLLSLYVTGWLGEGESGGPVDVLLLTVMFFMLNFLAATQDIAVDGWALTMLRR